jgi:hypothetical protein
VKLGDALGFRWEVDDGYRYGAIVAGVVGAARRVGLLHGGRVQVSGSERVTELSGIGEVVHPATPSQCRQAAYTAAVLAVDGADCLLLLDVLGLVGADRRPVGWMR